MAKHVKKMGADAVSRARRRVSGKRDDVPGPSENPMTNFLLADLMIRAGSYVARDAIERKTGA